jgi:ubiquinone/menaquinone biosynthesis C-methylase UbiE
VTAHARRTGGLLILAATAFTLAAIAGWLPAACQDISSESEWARRDQWQRPQEVMDELGLTAGSAVADVGAGRGYFVLRLAARVGPTGKVYAVDIDENDLGRIRRRADDNALTQVETIHSSADDPRLPSNSVDAILVVNAYHEMRSYDPMLQGLYRALRPGGRLAIIDGEAEAGKARSTYYSDHEIPESLVREDAERNGFRFLRRPRSFRTGDGDTWYFLLFEKPVPLT